MKTLYIHIGTPKTATTAIQNFLTDNPSALKDRSFCYPKATKKYPGVSIRRNGHFLSGFVRGEKPNPEEEKKIIRCGMERVNELFQSYDNVVLSDESIWHVSSYKRDFLWELLAEIKAQYNFQIKIIVYLRRQDDYIMSLWNQMVKNAGETRTWEEYFSEKKNIKVLKYYEKLDTIAEYLGKENIIVRRFDRASFLNGSIFDDFLDAIGLVMSDDFVIKKSEPNQNLPGNLHEFQRMLNSIEMLSVQEKLMFSSLLQKMNSASKDSYKYSMMSKQEREEYLDKFREGNEKIAEEYICDGKPMYNYDIPDLPKWDKNNPFFEDDMMKFNKLIISEYRKARNKLDKIENGRIYKLTGKIKRLFRKNKNE